MRLTRKHLSSPTLIPDDCREMPRLSSCFCLSCAKKIQREKLFSILFCVWRMVLWNMNYRTSRHKQNASPDKTVQIIVAVTCAISSVFLSFSSQVTVISCISFSDSSSLSFSSGAFIDCRGTWLLTCCFWHFATSYYENDKKSVYLSLRQLISQFLHFLSKFPDDPGIGVFIDHGVVDDALCSVCIA